MGLKAPSYPFLAVVLTLGLLPSWGLAELAPDFQTNATEGQSFALHDFSGQPVILHITNIENPLCRECEEALRDQTAELALLKKEHPEINLATLNIRKNPYSEDGKNMSRDWWGLEVNWPWAEDFDPFPASGKYIDYWTFEGGFANPTLILIDRDGQVGRVYHVYKLGEGFIDGVQSAGDLYAALQSLDDPAAATSSDIASQSTSLLGMFGLGIITSFSPCSIALMIAVFTYILNTRRKKSNDGFSNREISSSREGLMIGIAFTLGMAAVFFVIGLFISQLGFFVRGSRFFDLLAGLLMIMLGIGNFKPLEELAEPLIAPFRRRSLANVDRKTSLERIISISMRLFEHSALIGAFSLGIFFALGWAPCAVSLVFPVIIWLMAQNVTPLGGGVMLFVFGLGHGVPIIPIATFSRTVSGKIGDRYIAAGKWTTRIFGAAVIAVGLVYAARYFGYLLW